MMIGERAGVPHPKLTRIMAETIGAGMLPLSRNGWGRPGTPHRHMIPLRPELTPALILARALDPAATELLLLSAILLILLRSMVFNGMYRTPLNLTRCRRRSAVPAW